MSFFWLKSDSLNCFNNFSALIVRSIYMLLRRVNYSWLREFGLAHFTVSNRELHKLEHYVIKSLFLLKRILKSLPVICRFANKLEQF